MSDYAKRSEEAFNIAANAAIEQLQTENAALRTRVGLLEALIPLAKEVMHYCSGLADNGLSWQNRVEFPKLAMAIQSYEELEAGEVE